MQQRGSSLLACDGSFHSAPPQLRPEVADFARRVLLAETERWPTDALLYQGDSCGSFYLVLSGWVCLYCLLDDGRRQNLGFALPGDLVGFAFDPRQELAYSAEAVTPVRLAVGARGLAACELAAMPAALQHLGRYLLWQQTVLYQQLLALARMDARERIAHLLFSLALRLLHRSPAPSDRLLIPLTQQQIGDALGLTSVHVSRTLSSLSSEGLLTLRRGLLQVTRPNRLAEVAHLEGEGLYDSHPLLENRPQCLRELEGRSAAAPGLTLRAPNLV